MSTGWDYGASNQIPNPNNFNPYAGIGFNTMQRNALHYTINDMLFYTNYNDSSIIPWIGESWEYAKDFTEITVKLRKGVTWADGELFTAKDVVFTFETLIANAPEMILSAAMKNWITDAAAIDDFLVRITLSKPAPRWAADFLAGGQAARLVWLPEHVFKDQDPKTFEFYDPGKGWPFGTGPYTLVRADENGLIFDRRDTWWADELGVMPLPAVERIVVKAATTEARPNLYMANELDIGGALPLGTFTAARAQNPGLRSWYDQGPIWGGPDGCVYRILMNNQAPPFDDPEIRWAFNYAINRQQIVDLAYEGASRVTEVPFSSYGVSLYMPLLQDVIDKHQANTFDPQKTAEILTAKGYTKNSAGRWIKPDGSDWPLTLIAAATDPQAPVIVEQLTAAGFDIVASPPAGDEVTVGNFELHRDQTCGSIDDPWQSLRYLHSQYVVPPGEPIREVRSRTRYGNPEMDEVLDRMEAMVPSRENPTYVELARKATDILLRDMPCIYTAEEFWIVAFNETYWTGWPTGSDPYVAPYIPWEGFNQAIYRLKPTR